jgi:hypothetical protein
VDLAPFDGLVPTVITPAASITLVYAQMKYVVEDDQISWLLYASKKYPNLKSTISKLKLAVTSKRTWKRSEIYIQLFILHRMDEHRCQIKNIALFSDHDNTCHSALSQSNQARHIENLSIYDVKRLEVLESLTIDFETDDLEGSDEIDINMLLNSRSKTVKSIKLSHCKYCFTVDFDYSFQLEELRLYYDRTPANIDHFISNCLPNLRENMYPLLDASLKCSNALT